MLGLTILDKFTKQVGFGLTHIAEYSWLDTTQTDLRTRIANPSGERGKKNKLKYTQLQ